MLYHQKIEKRDQILKKLRAKKPGRPYQPSKHFSREELIIMRNKKIDEILEYFEEDTLYI